MNLFSNTLRAALPLLIAPAAAAQVVVLDGDTYPGVAGVVESISQVTVSDAGWLVEARTSSPHEILIGSGGLISQQGDSLPMPVGAIINNWDGIYLNNAGNRSHNIYISGTEGTVYWNDVFQLAEGEAPTAAGFPAGSTYIDFREAIVNDANQLLVQGSVGPGFDDFLLIRNLDAAGALVSEELVVMNGDVLPGFGAIETIDFIHANGDEQTNFNNNGDIIFGVKINGVLFPNTNDAYYIKDANGFTLVAREGETDPLSGRTWKTLGGSVDLNDNGDFCYKGRYDAPGSGDWAIVKNNTEILAVEGESIPAIAPHTFSEFTNFLPSLGPVILDNAGNVYWFGEWKDTGGVTQGRAIFKNQDILAQEGVVTVDGNVVEIIFGDEFAVSDSGQFLIFSGISGGSDGAFILDLAEFDEFCFGDGGVIPGCTMCPCGNDAAPGTIGGCLNLAAQSARLLPSGLPSLSNDTLRFEMTGGNINTFGVLVSADNALPNMGPCAGLNSGIQSGTLDGLRCVGGSLLRHGARPTDANGDIGFTTNGWGPPNGPAGGILASSGFTAGQTRNFQCFYRELGTAVCGTGQNTSQAIGVDVLP